MTMYVGVTMWFFGGENVTRVSRMGFRTFLPKKLVVVDFGRKKWFSSILAENPGFGP